MVTETVETPTETPQVDPEVPQSTETETPATEVVAEGAAPEAEAAATPAQVEVTEQKPDYITRDEWEKEREAVRQQAAAQALEDDRRKRQTENARKAQQEERQKARIQQTVDTVRATLVSRGLDPEIATEQSVVTAIDRVAQERAEGIVKEQGNLVGDAWDFLTAPVYGKEVSFDDSYAEVAKTLGPKVQHLIDAIRPQIESEARKGYIAEGDLSARVDAEIARRSALGREGQEELKRVEGTPAPPDNSTIAERLDRIGTPKETAADRQWWNEREKARGRG